MLLSRNMLPLITISALGLSSCDFVYGLSTSTLQEGEAADTCVFLTLQRTPGVKDVKTRSVKNTAVLIAGKGPIDDSMIRYYTYNLGTGYSPTITIEDYYDGKTHYRDTMLSMNKKIPQEEIDRALPIMRLAEERISKKCGVIFGSDIRVYN